MCGRVGQLVNMSLISYAGIWLHGSGLLYLQQMSGILDMPGSLDLTISNAVGGLSSFSSSLYATTGDHFVSNRLHAQKSSVA